MLYFSGLKKLKIKKFHKSSSLTLMKYLVIFFTGLLYFIFIKLIFYVTFKMSNKCSGCANRSIYFQFNQVGQDVNLLLLGLVSRDFIHVPFCNIGHLMPTIFLEKYKYENFLFLIKYYLNIQLEQNNFFLYFKIG